MRYRQLYAPHLAGAFLAIAATLAPPTRAQETTSKTSASDTLEEVTVTAQRRSQRQQDVPITLTSLNPEQLSNSGVSGTTELSQVVPAFRMDYNGGFAQPSIRGVSTAEAAPGDGSNVATYVDGFYDDSPLTTAFEFPNINNVEVLKGPQGTLFGRNSTGGAIVVTTPDPSEKTALTARIGYASYDSLAGDFYATTGILDNVAVDLSALTRHSDGWITNVVTNNKDAGATDESAVRIGLKWSLSEDDYFLIRYYHVTRHDNTAYESTPYKDPDGRFETIGYGIPGVQYGAGTRTFATDNGFTPQFSVREDQATITGKFNVGFADLGSYSQYKYEQSASHLDTDSSSFVTSEGQFSNTDLLFTQEFLLTSKPGSEIDWVAGVFMMDQSAGIPAFFFEVPPLGSLFGVSVNIKSIAGYFDGTYHVVDGLYLTGGARYSYETDKGGWTCFPTGLEVGACTPSETLHDSWDNFSPRVVARYRFSEGSNVYASWTRGFKSGLLDIEGFQPNPVKPETISSYELGFKTARADSTFNASTFYYNYKDLQVATYNQFASITGNAANSEIYGAELSGSQRLFGHLTANAGGAWTHARYSRYLTAPSNVFDYTTGSITNTPTNVSGNTLTRAPEWTGNIGLSYALSVLGGQLDLSENVYYTSKIYFDPANHNVQDQYGLLNLRASWTTPGSHWQFAVFGNNVTNTEYKTQVLGLSLSEAVTWGAPAIWGGTVTFKY